MAGLIISRLSVILMVAAAPLNAPLSSPTSDLMARMLVWLPRLAGNSIGNLGADGEVVWAGTNAGLSKSIGEGSTQEEWITYTTQDGLAGDNVSALEVAQGEVWVAAAHGERMEISDGISFSRDNGENWVTLYPERATGSGNTVWDLAVHGDTVWAASWNGWGHHESGLIRSLDGGLTWESLRPNEKPNGKFTFAVLIDDQTVWVGTAAGISRSDDRGQNWVVYDTEDGLAGNWVFALDLQRQGNLSTLWASTWPAEQESETFGVSRTSDNGLTWAAVDTLSGRQAVDFAFQDSVVWIATTTGLWKSPDNGTTWTVFTSADGLADDKVYAVEVVSHVVWAGTADGLNASRDGGLTWRTIRASPPTAPIPIAETYAYPTPFSPLRQGYVKIRYSLAADGRISLTIFDYAGDAVITLLDDVAREGGLELAEFWDGKNSSGTRVANGVYFYRIVAKPEGIAWGKIVVLD